MPNRVDVLTALSRKLPGDHRRQRGAGWQGYPLGPADWQSALSWDQVAFYRQRCSRKGKSAYATFKWHCGFVTDDSVVTIYQFSEGLLGLWQGTVQPPDTKAELRSILKVSEDGDTLKANFYSIDQTLQAFPSTVTLQGSNVRVAIPDLIDRVKQIRAITPEATSGSRYTSPVPAHWVAVCSPWSRWARAFFPLDLR